MRDIPEINESPEKKNTKISEKQIDTFDDIKASDNSERINTFDDLRGRSSDKSIDTFDDLRKEAESVDIRDVDKLGESERISNTSSSQLSIDGRHRPFVAIKEGYDNVPVKLNDVYAQEDGKNIIDRRGITHVSFDKDVLNSEDMQNLMKEHDFKKWEQGEIDHKGFTYDDHVKEFGRLHECQEAIKNGHSPDELESLLGKEYSETYKRFYESNPIKIDRVIDIE